MEREKISLYAKKLVVGVDLGEDGYGREHSWPCLKNALRALEPLANSGLTIKIETILRERGYGVIRVIQEAGFGVFADTKLYATPNTAKQDARVLRDLNPKIVTVVVDLKNFDTPKIFKDLLPDVEVLGVLSLTTSRFIDEMGTWSLARKAKEIGLDGVVCPPHLLRVFHQDRSFYLGDDFTMNVPNIRMDGWEFPGEDDQNRKDSISPREAISLGAQRIIVSRPIFRNPARPDTLQNIHDFLGEIEEGSLVRGVIKKCSSES